MRMCRDDIFYNGAAQVFGSTCLKLVKTQAAKIFHGILVYLIPSKSSREFYI